MLEIVKYLWAHRTTVLGYMVVVLGVLATSDLFAERTIKWFVLIIGVVTAVLGHHNNSQLKAAAKKEEQ